VSSSGGQAIAESFAEDELARVAGELPAMWNARGQFGEFMIEQRTAYFERVRHGHAVDLHQHVAGELGGGFEIESLREEIRALL
jgi:hypothetical protein